MRTDHLLPGELDATTEVAGENICGYGYVNGEVPHPTPAKHAELIEMSRKLGRYLVEAEVRSVLCADGGHDGDY